MQDFVILVEKLQFFGDDPQNRSVEIGQSVVLNCRVQTTDPSTKIQWLRKLDMQQSFRPEAIVFGSEQYENIDQSQEQHYSNNILSKPLNLLQITMKDDGQYICLIQNDRATNYRKAFINVINHRKGKENESINQDVRLMSMNFLDMIPSANIDNNLLYVIVIPLCLLGLILFFIFCFRHRRQKNNRHLTHHSHSSDTVKSSLKQPRQPLIHQNGTMIPSTGIRTSNDYIGNSVDSIPITRQQRYALPLGSDLASLTSSNLYYARVQAL